eukprot:4402598-Pyramimonas_sp.AAC.1
MFSSVAKETGWSNEVSALCRLVAASLAAFRQVAARCRLVAAFARWMGTARPRHVAARCRL